MLRERVVSLGRRDARGRIAYLLCELLWRHTAVGLTNGEVIWLPLRMPGLLDVEELQTLTGFKKDYFHLAGASAEVVRYFKALEEAQQSKTYRTSG